MWKPVGNLPAEVYWRRRVLIGLAAVLVVITAAVVFVAMRGSDSDAGRSDAGGPSLSDGAAAPTDVSDPPGASTSSPPPASPPTASDSVAGTSPAGSPAGAASSANSSASSSAPDAVPAACTGANLRIAASTSLGSYPVGASPGLNMVVTNVGAQPCVADLSDGNIVLLVYFGDARIWGSHDCSIEPGSSPQTLPANEPVTRQIVWTGLSSNEGCTATRQRVGAGTYTLQPIFAGQAGAPATFSIV